MIQWSQNNLIVYCLTLLLFNNVFGSELIIHQEGFSAAQKIGALKILKDREGYAVLAGDGVHRVHNHDVSQSLKEMDNNQLTRFLNDGHGVIKMSQFSNGEFKLDRHVYGKGGGLAGFWIGATLGKVVVSTVGYGTIGLISAACGPAGIYVGPALTTVLVPYIESAGVYGAAVVGMNLGASTGPV